MPTIIYESKIKKEWVDYNGHMNDAEYARVFSLSVDQLMNKIGVNEFFREKENYTLYTLETHIMYMAEAFEEQSIHVTVQIIDYDEKLLHPFFVMKNEQSETLATSEQMLIGIDQETGRPANFPKEINHLIKELATKHEKLPKPTQVGRYIGIKRK